jgi:hypothetical protein
MEGRIEAKRRQGRRRKPLLDDFEKNKIGNWKLKEEAIDCIPWRTRLGRGYDHVVRQTTV